MHGLPGWLPAELSITILSLETIRELLLYLIAIVFAFLKHSGLAEPEAAAVLVSLV